MRWRWTYQDLFDAVCYAHSDLWTQGTVGPTVSMERAGFPSEKDYSVTWLGTHARVLPDRWVLVSLSPPIIEIGMEF